jgi:hypothetical protein
MPPGRAGLMLRRHRPEGRVMPPGRAGLMLRRHRPRAA